MFGEILQKFTEKSPVTVMVQGLLERILNPTVIDEWFDSVRGIQYTRDILFSSVLSVMLQAVCRIRSSVHLAYLHSDITASKVALYEKLKGTEINTSRELVRHVARESESLIREINGTNPVILPGYRVKYLDGNCIEATEHRLDVLRNTSAGALPGKSLVVFDPELGIAIDVIPCEDGHAQERSLLSEILKIIHKNDLWVADRNFCVLSFLFGIARQGGFFNIREHNNMPWTPKSAIEFIGETETGKIYEQKAVLISGDNEKLEVRRVVVKLNNPTRNGETELALFTNIPVEDADAVKISEIYRLRWGVETAFQKLEKHLNSEINTLAYPKAALFGFCVALAAFNIYAVVMASLRIAHPDKDINEEVSEYYIAEEISTTYTGMIIGVPDEEWDIFRIGTVSEVGVLLVELASRMDLSKFKKHKRGPKKPPPPKNKFKGKPHVSTAKLLALAG